MCKKLKYGKDWSGENWGRNIWQKLRWQNMAEKEKLAKPGAKRRADDVWQWSLKDGKGVCNEEAHRKQHQGGKYQ